MGKHLVLVGGGHAHMTCLAKAEKFIRRGHRVTLISPSAYQYYSGMGPGMLSGIYRLQEVRFHIKKTAEDRGAAFVKDRVIRIDPHARRLYLSSGRSLPYDVASFNTGSEVAVDGLSMPSPSAVPVKPIVNLYRARRQIADTAAHGDLRVVVIGGGAAGVEIAGNLWRLLEGRHQKGEITLVGGQRVLKDAPERVRRIALDSLQNRGIRVLEGARVKSLSENDAILSDGTPIAYDLAFLAMGVKPTTLFRDSGLCTGEQGGLLVNHYLQSVQAPELFGGGDCIELLGHRLARVGVYAVRQNPILYHNLMAALEGRSLKPFDPGGEYLLILNLGNGRGLAWRGRWVWEGFAAFFLKHGLDKHFMRKFQLSGELAQASDGRETLED